MGPCLCLFNPKPDVGSFLALPQGMAVKCRPPGEREIQSMCWQHVDAQTQAAPSLRWSPLSSLC